MTINVLFFGASADITGKSKIEFTDVNNTDGLRKLLVEKYNSLQKLHFVLALNKKVVKENTKLSDGDTVAILPPFSGG